MVDVASADSLAERRRGDEEFRGTQKIRRLFHRQSAIRPQYVSEGVPGPISNAQATKLHSRTDAGTIILHWISAIAVLTSIATGLRIASDAPFAPISQFLSPVLPQGEIWTVHFIAGLALFFSSVAYPLYLRRSGLKRRVAVKRLLVFTLPAAKRLLWGATNVALHWLAFILLVVLTMSGIVLYLGYGGWIVKVHTISAFAVVGYILGHVASHFAYGGLDQILRVFRPSRLVWNRSVRPRPLLSAVFAGLAIMGAVAATDWATRDTLAIAAVSGSPILDGNLDDPAWRRARPVTLMTQQGVNLGGSGQSQVEIRAVRDAGHIYFAFRWADPTRSAWREPLIKKADGWHVLQDRAATADVMTYYEDKFSVLFSRTPAFGSGDGTHLGPKPLAGKPASLHLRGLHYTDDGSYLDVWQWKSTRGGLLGRVDDMHFGPPVEPSPEQIAGTKRYSAGYKADPGKAFYSYNYKTGERGFDGPVAVPRLPRNLAATQAAMGPFELDPEYSLAPNARWWMHEDESVPYSAEADAAIPVGTVIPGVNIAGEYEGDRADIAGSARWQDGYWTLEAARRLETGSRYDVDFVAGEPLYMWVAVFDHTQIRHTRHARPVRVMLR